MKAKSFNRNQHYVSLSRAVLPLSSMRCHHNVNKIVLTSSTGPLFRTGFRAQARVLDCHRISGLRQDMYRIAANSLAIYADGADRSSIEYDGPDLEMDLMFFERTGCIQLKQLLFEVTFRRADSSCWCTEVPAVLNMDDLVMATDYDGDDCSSPAVTVSSGSTYDPATTARSIADLGSDILTYQSIEDLDFARHCGDFEKCYLKEVDSCETSEEQTDENNCLAFSPTFHLMFNNRPYPTVKISFVTSQPFPDPCGRYEVLIRVEFFSVASKNYCPCTFKSGIKHV